MKDEDKSKEELIQELVNLRREVDKLKQNQQSREDKLKLAMIDRAPFTFWAADRNFKIVLWSQTSERVYGIPERHALGRDYVDLFVDGPEKQQSREDCIRIIDEDIYYRNFLAYDVARDGSRRTMLTNCFRIWDEESKQHLQAEIGLEISDLELRKDEHRTLREMGVARIQQEKKVFDLTQRELVFRLKRALLIKRDSIDIRIRELDDFGIKLKRTGSEKEAEAVTASERQKLMLEKQRIEQVHDQIVLKLMRSKSQEELDQIEASVTAYET
jgi:PAS domain S-box-containing protein